MTHLPLPVRASDAIHRLIECNGANNRVEERAAAVQAASLATARFREAAPGGWMKPSSQAYSHLEPLCDALSKLHGTFSATALASSERGMQAAQETFDVLQEAQRSPEVRVLRAFSNVAAHVALHGDEVTIEALGPVAQARWKDLSAKVVLLARDGAYEGQIQEHVHALVELEPVLNQASTSRALGEDFHRKWCFELQPAVADALAHYEFNRMQAQCKLEQNASQQRRGAPAGSAPIVGTSIRESMTREYELWLKAQNLDLGCAMEALVGNDSLTQDQRKWLSDYVIRWEAMERAERFANMGLSPAGDSHEDSLERVLCITDSALTDWRETDEQQHENDRSEELAIRETEWLNWRPRLVAAMRLLEDVPTDVLLAAQSPEDLIEALQQGQGMKP